MKRLIAAAAILTVLPLLIAGSLPVPQLHDPAGAIDQATRVLLLFVSVSL